MLRELTPEKLDVPRCTATSPATRDYRPAEKKTTE